jgi:hypothetical protein
MFLLNNHKETKKKIFVSLCLCGFITSWVKMPAMTKNINIAKEKGWAGAVVFFLSFTGIILGAIAGGLIGRFRATLLLEECSKQVLQGAICGEEPAIFLGSVAAGLTTGAILGLMAGLIFYLTYFRRLKISRLAVKGLDDLAQPGKNGGAPEKA